MTTLTAFLRESLTVKVFFIAFLILLLLIPMGMVKSLISERAHLYFTANTEVTRTWGENHTFTGPVLTFPHTGETRQVNSWISKLQFQHLAPDSLSIRGKFETQIRYRGIYPVPVYLGKISSTGKFILPEQANLSLADEVLIQFPMSNTRALKIVPELIWNGSKQKLIPVRNQGENDSITFQAKVALDKSKQALFELNYETAGSGEFNIHPWARQTSLKIISDWGSPSFHGAYFPDTHNIRDDGFSANWLINNIFVNSKETGEENINLAQFSELDMFGVKFLQLTDTYTLLTRASKYAVLFIGLTFVICFLIEAMGQKQLHTIQYLLIGLSNCLFYLLLLSLAEHTSFKLAYFVSATASTLLISLYSKSIFQNMHMTITLFGVLVALYIYLFITLLSEGYALLIGSLGLFTIMAVLMYKTRNTNWYELSRSRKTETSVSS